MKSSNGLVVLGHGSLALEHVNFNPWLVVTGGRENLRFLCRNRGIAFNQFGEDTSERLNTERKRCHIQKKNIFNISLENSALDCGADRDDFIRIHSLMGRLVNQRFCGFNNFGHPSHPPDQNELLDISDR